MLGVLELTLAILILLGGDVLRQDGHRRGLLDLVRLGRHREEAVAGEDELPLALHDLVALVHELNAQVGPRIAELRDLRVGQRELIAEIAVE